MKTNENSPERIGFLANITAVIVVLLPLVAYITLWWLIPKTSFIAIFLTVTVGGPIWFIAEMVLTLCASLAVLRAPSSRIDEENEGSYLYGAGTTYHSH